MVLLCIWPTRNGVASPNFSCLDSDWHGPVSDKEARPSPHDYPRHNFCDQRTGYEEPFWPAVISNRINKPYERKFT